MYSLLILFATLAISFSFLCSLWEAVLLSVTPTYADLKREEGGTIGRQLHASKSNIDRPLAAILTLNTIAHTVGAIGVGDQAATIWAETNPWVTKLIIPVAMTLGILILSEIIPKTIGATYWRQLTPFAVRSLQIIVTLLAPLVWLSQLLTRLLKRGRDDDAPSRSEFLTMAKIGAQHGVIDAQESAIIGSLLRFERVRARDIMTPRTVVVAAPEDMSIEAYYRSRDVLAFSRIPVYQGATDNITGFILKDELLARLVAKEGDRQISSIRREIPVIGEDYPLPDLFSTFLSRRDHIALVVDEFGGMAGIVTMEDVIETLLGLEIVDESDHAEDMQAHARAQWEQRAKARGINLEAALPTTEAPSTDG